MRNAQCAAGAFSSAYYHMYILCMRGVPASVHLSMTYGHGFLVSWAVSEDTHYSTAALESKDDLSSPIWVFTLQSTLSPDGVYNKEVVKSMAHSTTKRRSSGWLRAG